MEHSLPQNDTVELAGRLEGDGVLTQLRILPGPHPHLAGAGSETINTVSNLITQHWDNSVSKP